MPGIVEAIQHLQRIFADVAAADLVLVPGNHCQWRRGLAAAAAGQAFDAGFNSVSKGFYQNASLGFRLSRELQRPEVYP